ncbi:MAG: tRNA epoxyqueuosine(34) reductase QueG [Dehalococcoidia bacterium]
MKADREAVLAMVRAEGFELAGIAPASEVPEARAAAQEARQAGRLADMRWMTAEWIERSTRPDAFLAGAKSIVVVALPNHSPEPDLPGGGGTRGRVARYARGRDYHRVFESKLRRVARRMREEFGAEARGTVDYGPLLERPYASLAGLAWLGKSSMALVPGFGPWVMLGAVATTLELETDAPLKKSCGSCSRCIVACPTGAIAPDGQVVDSRLCISYHTIENRGVIPRELREKFGGWVFGCDACLDSCPVGATRFESHADFVPKGVDDAFPVLAELLELDEDGFRERFRGRAVTRAKRDGMARNACVALGNVGGIADLALIVRALSDVSPLVRGHAAWALGRLSIRWERNEEGRAVLEHALADEQDSYVREELLLALEDIAGGHDG